MNPAEQQQMTEDYVGEALYTTEKDWNRDVTEFLERAGNRIATSGAEQYFDEATNQMKFESMPMTSLFHYLEEEILDIANYAAMIAHKAKFPGEREAAKEMLKHAFELWKVFRERQNLSKGARAFEKAVVAEHTRQQVAAEDALRARDSGGGH